MDLVLYRPQSVLVNHISDIDVPSLNHHNSSLDDHEIEALQNTSNDKPTFHHLKLHEIQESPPITQQPIQNVVECTIQDDLRQEKSQIVSTGNKKRLASSNSLNTSPNKKIKTTETQDDIMNCFEMGLPCAPPPSPFGTISSPATQLDSNPSDNHIYDKNKTVELEVTLKHAMDTIEGLKIKLNQVEKQKNLLQAETETAALKFALSQEQYHQSHPRLSRRDSKTEQNASDLKTKIFELTSCAIETNKSLFEFLGRMRTSNNHQ